MHNKIKLKASNYILSTVCTRQVRIYITIYLLLILQLYLPQLSMLLKFTTDLITISGTKSPQLCDCPAPSPVAAPSQDRSWSLASPAFVYHWILTNRKLKKLDDLQDLSQSPARDK